MAEPSTTPNYQCSLSECSVARTGKCVNGVVPAGECPNSSIYVNTESETSIQSENIPVQTTNRSVKFGSGYGFSNANLNRITAKKDTKMVVVIGEPQSGKSTIYASLFDRFHQKGCGEYIFHSSRTPLAFEEICHLAREKCKGKTPKTERTKSYEYKYFHLSVRNKSLLEKPRHLIFADVNGERYQNAKDKDEEMQQLDILRRADTVFFLADGELLLDSSEKHVVKSDANKFLQRAIQNDIVTKERKINLIISKWDKVNAAHAEEMINDFFIEPFKARFKNYLEQVLKVASRSLNPEIPAGYGLPEFLKLCLAPSNYKHIDDLQISSDRDFQNYIFSR